MLSGDVEVANASERRVAVTVFEEVLIDAFTFLFRGAVTSELPIDFERLVETALTRTLQNDGMTATVDMSLHEFTRARLEQKLEATTLNRAEIPYYLEQDILTDPDDEQDR